MQVPVANESELVGLTQRGLARRTVAATCMNAASSRSHCLITLMVQRGLPGKTTDAQQLVTSSTQCAHCQFSYLISSVQTCWMLF